MNRTWLLSLTIACSLSASATEPLSGYQQRVQRIHEGLYGVPTDVLAPDTKSPQLDDATRFRLLGELQSLDPYWLLEQQLVYDLNALERYAHDDKSILPAAAACVDILALLREFGRVPPTKEQAEAEVAQLRAFIFRRDFAGAEKLMRSWHK